MRGGAQSHLMRCDDGYYYVVKFQNNPQHRRVLVNELLGTRLAARLGLPTVPVEIVAVSEELIRLTPDLAMEMPRSRIPCQPGLQFGSRYPGDPQQLTLHDFLPDEQLREVENLHDFAGMLVFDKWTCNTNGRQTVGVTGMESFAPWMERLEKQMTERTLDEITRPIPPEWYADDYDALLALLEQLHRRRVRVPDLILEAKRCNRQPFPNWM